VDSRHESANAQLVCVVNDAVRAVTEVDNNLTPQTRLIADLGLDSLTIVELYARLEESLGVNVLDDPAAFDVVSIGDLASYLALAGGGS